MPLSQNLQENKNIIEVKDLNISFKRKRKKPLHVVRGIDLEIKKGTIVGIVGESGSGKSVTTKALLNLNYNAITKFDHLKIEGESGGNLKEVNFKNIRGKEVAYIPQNPMSSLNPSRKIWRHLDDVIGLNIDKYKTDYAERGDKVLKHVKNLQSSLEKDPTNKEIKDTITFFEKAEKTFAGFRKFVIFEILDKFKISQPLKSMNLYPHEMSGGMKQRVIIAIGILAGAKTLIADEPTTALDPIVQSSVLQLLQEVNKKYGTTIIFISHNIALVAKFVDYIYVMYAGKVLEKGATEILFKKPSHPYTWALISSLPLNKAAEAKLTTIPGSPPDLNNLPIGDPFAERNKFSMKIDFKKEAPLFEIQKGHYAATWLAHPSSPKVEIPKDVKIRLKNYKGAWNGKEK